MNVHNIMEDIVKKNVDDLYEQVKKDGCKWKNRYKPKIKLGLYSPASSE